MSLRQGRARNSIPDEEGEAAGQPREQLHFGGDPAALDPPPQLAEVQFVEQVVLHGGGQGGRGRAARGACSTAAGVRGGGF